MNGRNQGAFSGGRRLLEPGGLERARLTLRLLRDDRVSVLKYALPALALLYIMSPVDAIPDLILGVGQTDDVGIAVAAALLVMRTLPKLAPAHVVDEHLREMEKGSRVGDPETRGPGPVIDARYNVRR